MKTKLSRIAVLLASVVILPFVEGCYGDKVNLAAAWMPAEFQGIIIGAGAAGTTGTAASSGTTGSAFPGASGAGNYIP